jgi:hypothetical protein
MQPPANSTVVLLAILPLLAWRVYSRFRRAVGRQRLSAARPWITLSIFSLVVVLLVYLVRAHTDVLGWMAGGLAAGTLLGVYGLRATRFEPLEEGLFFTPNAYLGIALSLLFFGRMLYRVFEVYSSQSSGAPVPPDFARHPFTLAVFGLLAGYYVTYAVGLLRWRGRVLRAGSNPAPSVLPSNFLE